MLDLRAELGARRFRSKLCGILEEAVKGLPLYWLFIHLRKPTTVREASYLGTVSGLAFGVAEAVSYSFQYAFWREQQLFGYGDYVAVQLLRFITLPLLHAMWAGILGYFIGLAANFRHRANALVIVGWAAVALLHGLYDALPPWPALGVTLVTFLLFIGYSSSAEKMVERMQVAAWRALQLCVRTARSSRVRTVRAFRCQRLRVSVSWQASTRSRRRGSGSRPRDARVTRIASAQPFASPTERARSLISTRNGSRFSHSASACNELVRTSAKLREGLARGDLERDLLEKTTAGLGIFTDTADAGVGGEVGAVVGTGEQIGGADESLGDMGTHDIDQLAVQVGVGCLGRRGPDRLTVDFFPARLGLDQPLVGWYLAPLPGSGSLGGTGQAIGRGRSDTGSERSTVG